MNVGAARISGLKQLARLCAIFLVLVIAASGNAAQSPEVGRGLSWLSGQVQGNGSLAGGAGSVARPVQAETDALHTLAVLEEVSQPLALRVAANDETSTESLARSAIALSYAGQSPAGAIVALQKHRNLNGGFGDEQGSASNPLDTAWALLAFRVSGFSDASTLKTALDYLVSQGRTDGGYAVPGESNSVYATSYALQALVAYRDAYALDPYINKSIGWLLAVRGGSGSYGSPLYDALGAIALSAATTDATQYTSLLAALRTAQGADGSWAADPYLTSLALRALSGKGQPPPAVAQGRVAGRVVDAASRRPLPGSGIAIAGLDLRTNAEGRFETVEIAPGSYPLSVTRAGYLSVQQEVVVASAVVNNLGDIQLALPAGGALLHGAVFDGDTGQPLQGAAVQVNSGSSLLSAVTDASGLFEIGGISVSAITVSVQKAGYRSITTGLQVTGGASYAFSPALYAESGETPDKAVLTGRVIDEGSGQHVAAAQVTAGGKSAVSAADGRFQIAEIEPGAAQLSVTAAGYQSASFNTLLAKGQNQAGDLALKSASASMTVFGKVIRYGSSMGIAGAVVRVQGTSRQAVTNAQGDYRIEGLPEKHLTLIVSAAGHYTQTYPVNAAEFGSYRLNLQLTRAEDRGLSLVASSDLPSYSPFSDVQIAVTAANQQAQSRQIVFSAQVYDSEHRLVDAFPFRLLNLGQAPALAAYTVPASGNLDLGSKWHTQQAAAGEYSIVVSGATPEGEVLAQASVGIRVKPQLSIGGGILLDPPITQAGTSQPVSVSAQVANSGNIDYAGGPVRLSVVLERPDPYAPQDGVASVQTVATDARLGTARGAVTDAAGNLYTVNTTSGTPKVLKVAPSGAVSDLATLNSVILRDLARMPDGSLRVMTTQARVFPVSTTGVVGQPTDVLTGGGIVGMGIAADDQGNLFVAGGTPGNRSLVRISGGQQTVLLRNGLSDPKGIATGPDGSLYVSNFGDSSIARVDSSGRVEPFVNTGLNKPTALLATSDGGLLVADSGSNRILKVAADRTTSVFATSVPSAQGMAYHPSGDILVTSSSNTGLLRISPSGAKSGFAPSFGSTPSAAAYDTTGRLHVAGQDGALRRLNANGSVDTLLASGLSFAQKLVFGSDGAVYSVRDSNNIMRYQPGASAATTFATGLNAASGLAQDPAGNWLVAERTANRITRIGAGGVKETLAQPLMNAPRSIAVSADGTRYVLGDSLLSRMPADGRASVLMTNLWAATDIAINPAGGVYVLWGTQLMAISESGDTTNRAVPSSSRLAVAADGTVYLSASLGGNIYRLGPDNQLNTFSSLPDVVSDLDVHPEGGLVAALPDGYLYRIAANGTFARGDDAVGAAGSLSVAADGASYLLLDSGDFVRVDAAGQVSTLLSGLVMPTGFARHASGSYDIIDGASNELQIYDSANQLRDSIATFSSPFDVEWAGDEIVFADSSRVYRMSPDEGLPRVLASVPVRQLRYSGGVLYGQIASTGRLVRIGDDGSVSDVYAGSMVGTQHAFAVRGNEIAITSRSDHRVLLVDAGGALQAEYRGVTAPGGIALDSQGRTWVTISSGVIRYSQDGRRSEVFPLDFAKAVALGPDGSMWGAGLGKVYRFEGDRFVVAAVTTGQTFEQISSLLFRGEQLYLSDVAGLRRVSGDKLPVFATGIDDVVALEVGPDGALYMVGSTGTVKRFAAGALQVVTTSVPQPRSLVFRGGELYVGTLTDIYHVNLQTGAVLPQGIQPTIRFADLQGLTLDLQGRILAVGYSSKQIHRVEPTSYTPPPPAGTEVHTLQASLAPIPVNGTTQALDLGSWIPPYAGEYSLRLQAADGVAGGQAFGTLYVGPHARGAMTTDSNAVSPGAAPVGVRIGVAGAGAATLTKADASNLQLLQTGVRPMAIGTGPTGETYFLESNRIQRLSSAGVRTNFFVPTAYSLTSASALPVDSQGNLYVANSLNQLLRVRPDGTAQALATVPGKILDVVLDSRGDAIVSQENQAILYRVAAGTGSVTPIQSGLQFRVTSLTIDSQDNLFVYEWGSGIVAKIRPDGAISIVLDGAVGFEENGEKGPRIANDCADNLLVAPGLWPEMGQGSGNVFVEEHTLVQIEKTGRATQLLDGRATTPRITDLDFIVYDRYGQNLVMWTDLTDQITRMPIRCGYISTDLHVVVPAGQGLSGFDPPPSTIAGRPDGSQEYVWKLQDIAASPERQVRYETLLSGMQLGEERAVALEAFLLFHNSFAEGSIKLPLSVPKVVAGAGSVSMALAVAEANYPAQAAVDISLTLQASGPAVRGRLRLELFDASGGLVRTLVDENHSVVSGNPIVLNPPLDTGSYQAGNYQLRAKFTDEAGSLQAKADAGFGILASGAEPGGDSAIKVVTTTGRVVYGEFDVVEMLGRVRSHASNYSHDNVELRLTVFDPQGAAVYSESRAVAQLGPGAVVDLPGRYQLPGSILGNYRLHAEVRKADGSVLAEGSSAFEVRADDAAKLGGNVAVGARNPYLGETQTCRDTVTNGGARALDGLPLRRRVVEFESNRLVSEELTEISVEAGGSQVLNRSFSTAGYGLSNHACVLEAQVAGQWKTLGYDSFKVQDAPVRLSGTVVAAVDPVPQGETQTCRDTIRNVGPRPATDMAVRYVVMQLSPERRLREDGSSVSLPPGGEQTGTRIFSTAGFEQGPHACVLEARFNNQWQTLAYDQFNVDPPPVRVTATLERGGRGRMLVLMDGARVNGSSKSEPEPAQQRQFLETLLSREGWSYTIVTDPEAFTWELRSGGYNVYALFSESAKLSERVQTELREAAYRGEGLLEAGAHDQRHHNFDDALGVKYQGKASQVTGVEVLATEPGPTGYADLALRDKPLKAQLNAATSLGRYLGNKGSDPSAVTTRRYGRGRSVYLGYDLLAEATLAGSNSLHAQLLLRSLAYIQPDYGQIPAGRVIPLRIRLENEAKPATGQLVLPMPNGATVVDAGTATANNGVLTWAVDLAQDEDETYTAWVRLPDAGGAVSFVAQLKIGGSVHATATLALSPVATGGLVEARALAGPISAFKQVANWLDKADVALRAGDAETALSHLAKASDELMKVQHASAGDLRLMIDQALLDAGRRLWNG